MSARPPRNAEGQGVACPWLSLPLLAAITQPGRGLCSAAGSSLCPSFSVFPSVSHQSLPPRAGHAPPAQAWLLRVKGRPQPPGRPRGLLGEGESVGSRATGAGARRRGWPAPSQEPSPAPSPKPAPARPLSGAAPAARPRIIHRLGSTPDREGAGAGPAPQGAQTPVQRPRAQSW